MDSGGDRKTNGKFLPIPTASYCGSLAYTRDVCVELVSARRGLWPG